MAKASYHAPANEGEAVEQAMQEDHAARRGPVAMIPVPQGKRIPAAPFLDMRYQGYDATTLLGAPELLLKNPTPGAKYCWKVRLDKQTSAWVRGGVLRPVKEDELDTQNPLAEYVIALGPDGQPQVAWESLALFEMAPQWVARFYEGPEKWALARLAQQSVDFSAKVRGATRGEFKGELTVKK